MSQLNLPTGILFADPRTNQRISLAQLSFFIANSNTPFPVYQDGALTIPYVQPIIADINGNFPPIYLDPTLQTSEYKVQLADASANVLYAVDDIFIPYPITTDTPALQYASDGSHNIVIPNPSIPVSPALQIFNFIGNVGIRIVGGGNLVGGVVQPTWKVGNATTGTQNALFAANNKPGFNQGGPAKWLPMLFNGTTYYVPCWLV
jgi:hypothetical protein